MTKTPNESHDEHRPDVGAYVKVFGALMVLTGITVVISKFHLPRPQAIGLGLFVAVIKAGLVGAVFMHLWGENKLVHKAVLFTAAGAAILILPMIDMCLVAHKVTARQDVASQHPHEGAEAHEGSGVETVTETIKLETPAPAPAAKKKPAAKKGR